MAAGRKRAPAALGFSVHTGWAAMVAMTGPAVSATVVDCRRIEMMPGADPERPRFVYHAAKDLPLPAARRLVGQCTALSRAEAKSALRAVLEELEQKGHQVVAGSVIVGNRPLTATLEQILDSHALLHSAEGVLFREAIRDALSALDLPVTEVPARELPARAQKTLRLTDAEVTDYLTAIGRAAGRPWTKDHRDACLAALLPLP